MALWTPSNLSSLRLWLTTRDASSITGETPVTAWDDKSPANISVVSSTVTLESALSGLGMGFPLMKFTSAGSSRFTLSPAINLATFTKPFVAIVFFRNLSTDYMRVLGSDARDKAPFVLNLNGTSPKTAICNAVVSHSTCNASGQLLLLEVDNSGGWEQLLINEGVAYGSGAACGTPTGSVFYIGYALPSYSNCYIGEVILCDNPSEDEKARIRAYLAWEWNKLIDPSSHTGWISPSNSYYDDAPLDFSAGPEFVINSPKAQVSSELISNYKQPQTSYNEAPWLRQPDNETQLASSISWKLTSTDQPNAVLPETISEGFPVVTINRVYTFGGDSTGRKIYTAPIATDGKIGPWSLDAQQVPFVTGITATMVFVTASRIYLVNGSTFYYATVKADGTIGTITLQGTANVTIGQRCKPLIINNKLFILGGVLDTLWDKYTKTTIADGVVNITGFTTPAYSGIPADRFHNFTRTSTKLLAFGPWSSFPERLYHADITDEEVHDTYYYTYYCANGVPSSIVTTKYRLYTFGMNDYSYTSTMTRADIEENGFIDTDTDAVTGNMPTAYASYPIVITSHYIYELRQGRYDNWTGGSNSHFYVYQESITGDVKSIVPEISGSIDNIEPGLIETAIDCPLAVINGVIDNPLEQFYDLVAPLPVVESFIPWTVNEIEASVEAPFVSVYSNLWRDNDPAPVMVNGAPWYNLYGKASLPNATVSNEAPVAISTEFTSDYNILNYFVTNRKLFIFTRRTVNELYVYELYQRIINEDGTLESPTFVMNTEFLEQAPAVCYTRNRLLIVEDANNSYGISKVYSVGINLDGSLGDWVEQPNISYPIRYPKLTVLHNRVMLIASDYHGLSNDNLIYTAPIDKFGFIGAWRLETLQVPQTGLIPIAFSGKLYLLGTNTTTLPSVEFDESGFLATSWTNITLTIFNGAYLPIISTNYFHQLVNYLRSAPIDANGDLGTWSSITTGYYFFNPFVIRNYLYGIYNSLTIYRRSWPEGFLNYTDQLEHVYINSDTNSLLPTIESELSNESTLLTMQGDIKAPLSNLSFWVGVTQFWTADLVLSKASLVADLTYDLPIPIDYICGDPWKSFSKYTEETTSLFETPFITTTTDMPYTAYGNFVVVNKRVYSIGGMSVYDENLNFINAFDKILYADIYSDGSLGPWTEAEVSLPVQCLQGYLQLLKNKLYFFVTYDGNYDEVNFIYRTTISDDGILGEWELYDYAPGSTINPNPAIFVTKNRLYYITDAIYCCEIYFNGDYSKKWELGPVKPQYLSTSSIVVFYDRVWFGQSMNNFAYESLIDEHGFLGPCNINNNAIMAGPGASVWATNKYIYSRYFYEQYTWNIYRATLNEDGTRSAWEIFANIQTLGFQGILFSTGNRLYSTLTKYIEFYGGTDNLLEPGYTYTLAEEYSLEPPNFKAPKASVYADVTVQNFDVYYEFPYPNGIPWQHQWQFNEETFDSTPSIEFFDNYNYFVFGKLVVTKEKMFYIGGRAGGVGEYQYYSKKIFVSDIARDGSFSAWRDTQNYLPIGLTSFGCFCSKSHVYIVGGHAWPGAQPFPEAGANYSSFTIYAAPIDQEGNLGAFIAVGTMPNVTRGAAIAYYADMVYHIGGYEYHDGEYWMTNEIRSAPILSDGSLGSWSIEATHYPFPIADAQAFITGGILHVFGGVTFSGDYRVTTNLCYKAYIHPTTKHLNSFSAAPSLVYATSEGSCVCSKNTAVIVGGTDYSESLSGWWYDSVPYIQYAPIDGGGLVGTWVTIPGPTTFGTAYGIINDLLYLVGGEVPAMSNSPIDTRNTAVITFNGGSINYTQYPWYLETFPDIAVKTRPVITAELGRHIGIYAPLPDIRCINITPKSLLGNYIVKKCAVSAATITASVGIGDFDSLVPEIYSDLSNDNVLSFWGDIDAFVPEITSDASTPIMLNGDFDTALAEITSNVTNILWLNGDFDAPIPEIKTYANPIIIDIRLVPPKVKYFAWDMETVIKYRMSKPIIRGTMFDVMCEFDAPKAKVFSWTEEAAGQLVSFKPTITSELTSNSYCFANINAKVPRLSLTYGGNTMINSPKVTLDAVAETHYFLTGQIVPKQVSYFSEVLVGKFMVASLTSLAPSIDGTAITDKFMSVAITKELPEISSALLRWYTLAGNVQSPTIKLDSLISLQTLINTILYSNISIQGSLVSTSLATCGIEVKKPRLLSDMTPDLNDDIIKFYGD